MKRNCLFFLVVIITSAMMYAQTTPAPSEENKKESGDSVNTSETKSSPEEKTEKDGPAKGDSSQKEVVEKEGGPSEDTTVTAKKEAVEEEKAAITESEQAIKETPTEGKEAVSVTGAEPTASGGNVGVLTIATVPESAFVIFDDKLKGKSPVIMKDIPVGKHIIMLKKKGFFAKKATVNVTAGSENELTFKLIKPVHLAITSDPTGASVQINREEVGKTPYSDSKLKPSTYIVVLSMEGHKKEQHSVTLNSGERDSMHVTLMSFVKAPEDTSSEKEKETKKEKSKLSSILDKVALGVFIGFSLIILLIELTQDK